jgi:dethiobiotin synthetase
MPHNPKRFWLTATDTDAGKTTIMCALLSALNQAHCPSIGFKPISSGCHHTGGQLCNSDTLALMVENAKDLPHDTLNPWCFEPAIAPHIAAARTDQTLSASTIAAYLKTQSAQYPHHTLLAEGAGGACIPLNTTENTLDLAQTLEWPIILVIGLKLGALNHAALTYKALTARKLNIAGWITNQIAPMNAINENLETLQTLIQSPCLGHIPYFKSTPTPQDCHPYLNLAPLCITSDHTSVTTH